MQLKSVRVQNFRCVRDSTEFTIDPKVTCLVGKNESGKTALLHALAKTHPIDASEIGPLTDLDYPRHEMNDLKRRAEQDDSATAVLAIWELDDEDRKALQELVGDAANDIGPISSTLKYDNKWYYSIHLEESGVVKHLLSTQELPSEEHNELAKARDVQQLKALLGAIADPTQRQKDLLARIGETFGDSTASDLVRTRIHQMRPHFAYFSEYARMPGKLSINDFKKKKVADDLSEGDQVFEALLHMIGRAIEDLEDITQFEYLKAELEAASNNITGQIFQYWTQNRHLKVQFDCRTGLAKDDPPFNEGLVLHTRIENTRHGVTTSFDERSAGFVWFFSFLVWFSQVKANYGDNVIILLDEPGLSLHAKAQGDLLRYIEERLALEHQVIYSTHSPFMIDPSNLLRARTVEDIYIEPDSSDPHVQGQDIGTKVGDDVLSTDRDTVFPLQACLGYEITQSLFVGKDSLLVEGPSDLLYMQWFKRRLADLGQNTLDDRWTITPVGGIDKVAAFMALFGANDIHVAVLTDWAHGQKGKVERLRQSKLMLDGHVLTLDNYAEKSEADIEDILGDGMYADLVNRCYSISGKIGFKTGKPADQRGRVVKRVEEHFRSLPPEAPKFDHFEPAEYLMRNPDLRLRGLDKALDRFQALFVDLNKLLPATATLETKPVKANAQVPG